MKILNAHVGTEDNDIILFVERAEKEFTEEEKELLLIREDAYNYGKEYYDSIGQNFYNKEEFMRNAKESFINKWWVFFDEINTCNSLGLISEILCQHTWRGRKIKENITFFAACNPYWLLKINTELVEVGLLNKKAHRKRNYVYSVFPLPNSLMNYIFDFGNLTKKDEEKYIQNIIEKAFKNCLHLNEKNENELNTYINIATKSISKSQNFIREFNDISSVSLREVRRFGLLFDFFLNKYFKYKKEVIEKEIKDNRNDNKSNRKLSKIKFLEKTHNDFVVD